MSDDVNPCRWCEKAQAECGQPRRCCLRCAHVDEAALRAWLEKHDTDGIPRVGRGW
jgi:hypothetical protein